MNMRSQPEEVCPDLFRMPERFREECAAATESGLARNAEEFWRFAVATEDHALEASIMSRVIAALIAARRASPHETRTDKDRLVDALSTIEGKPAKKTNEADDDSVLIWIAEQMRWHDLPDSHLRRLAREGLLTRRIHADPESEVRRLVREYKASRIRYEALADSIDCSVEHVKRYALINILEAMASAGIPTALRRSNAVRIDLSMDK